MKKETLRKFIEKEITYDATYSYKCEKCGHQSGMHYWIDHREVLASNIATEMGLKTSGIICDVINNVSESTGGNKKNDALDIMELIDDQVMALQD